LGRGRPEARGVGPPPSFRGTRCAVTTMSARSEQRPAWEAAFFSLLHPAQVAAVEAFGWIGEPMSSRVLYEVLDRAWPHGTVGYHVRHLAAGGVLEELYREPVRGVREHFYGLVR
jgi:hypothetical protein